MSNEATRSRALLHALGRPLHLDLVLDPAHHAAAAESLAGQLGALSGSSYALHAPTGGAVAALVRAAQSERQVAHVVGHAADAGATVCIGALVHDVLSAHRLAALSVADPAASDPGHALFWHLQAQLVPALTAPIEPRSGAAVYLADFLRGADDADTDVALLVRAARAQAGSIGRVITPGSPSAPPDYLATLQSAADAARRLFSLDEAAQDTAALVDRLDAPGFAAVAALGLAGWEGNTQQILHRAGLDAFAPLRAKMAAEGLPALAVDGFAAHYALLLDGRTGLVPEHTLRPVTDLPDAEALDAALEAVGSEALNTVVVLKLNGGLGTSMGLRRAKSLLPIRGALTFLDLIAQQASQAGTPLVLMNSFSTREDSLAALANTPLASDGLPLDFLQHKVPKIDRRTLLPATAEDPRLEWCPPGHGDLFTALVTSGTLDALLEAGRRVAFVSNADNLGAVLDTRILGHFVSRGLPFLMEVADRTEADRKGGHLALQDGQLVLRESAQCPPEDLEAFQDVSRHRYFNTNSIWIDLAALRRSVTAGGPLVLPLIRNAKSVDPSDATSAAVYQLESAMGSAIARFPGASAIRVARTRFAPVKTTADLLRVRSDAFVLTDDHRLVPNPAAVAHPVLIALDPRFYKLLPDLDLRFPDGPPSLVGCTSLSITGDVRFEADVVCRGAVTLENTGSTPKVVPRGTVLSGA